MSNYLEHLAYDIQEMAIFGQQSLSKVHLFSFVELCCPHSLQQGEFYEETGIYLRDVDHKDCSVMKIHIPYSSWQTFIALTKGSIPRPRTNGEFSLIKWILLDEIHKLP